MGRWFDAYVGADVVPPEGFEPSPMPPEGTALSPELRGLGKARLSVGRRAAAGSGSNQNKPFIRAGFGCSTYARPRHILRECGRG